MSPYTARKVKLYEYKLSTSPMSAVLCQRRSPQKRLFSWNFASSSDVARLACDDIRRYSEFLGAAGCGDSAIKCR
jgi:hypothetical protein